MYWNTFTRSKNSGLKKKHWGGWERWTHITLITTPLNPGSMDRDTFPAAGEWSELPISLLTQRQSSPEAGSWAGSMFSWTQGPSTSQYWPGPRIQGTPVAPHSKSVPRNLGSRWVPKNQGFSWAQCQVNHSGSKLLPAWPPLNLSFYEIKLLVCPGTRLAPKDLNARPP